MTQGDLLDLGKRDIRFVSSINENEVMFHLLRVCCCLLGMN